MSQETDNETAFFSSPYASAPESLANLSFAEAGRRPEGRQGLAARVRGRLGIRTSQRRFIWVAILVAACWVLWSHSGSVSPGVEMETARTS